MIKSVQMQQPLGEHYAKQITARSSEAGDKVAVLRKLSKVPCQQSRAETVPAFDGGQLLGGYFFAGEDSEGMQWCGHNCLSDDTMEAEAREFELPKRSKNSLSLPLHAQVHVTFPPIPSLLKQPLLLSLLSPTALSVRELQSQSCPLHPGCAGARLSSRQ